MFYQEIIKIYQWCKEKGISCTMESLFDGYKICFPDGADIIQHQYSYRAADGYVEPAGLEKSYEPVSMEEIKKILSKKYLTNK